MNDLNPDFISVHTAIKNEPDKFINLLQKYEAFSSNIVRRVSMYKRLSKTIGRNAHFSSYERGANIVFLLRLVSHGYFIFTNDGLFKNHCNENIEISHLDWHELLVSKAKPGDFVFLDPPYYNSAAKYLRQVFYKDNYADFIEKIRILSETNMILMANSIRLKMIDFLNVTTFENEIICKNYGN